MIQVEKLSYGFPAKDLYKEISFTLETASTLLLSAAMALENLHSSICLSTLMIISMTAKSLKMNSAEWAMQVNSSSEIKIKIEPSLNILVKNL